MIIELWREEEDSLPDDILSAIQHINVHNYYTVKHLSNHKEAVKGQT